MNKEEFLQEYVCDDCRKDAGLELEKLIVSEVAARKVKNPFDEPLFPKIFD